MLDVVASHGALDHHALDVDPLGLEGEVGLDGAGFDGAYLLPVAQESDGQPIAALDAVEAVFALRVGDGADGRALPEHRGADERLLLLVANHTAQILCACGDEKR